LLFLKAGGAIGRHRQQKPQKHKEGAMMDRMLNKLAGEDKQFPLIEVMVVMACVGILVTIALQRFLAH
jgi:prepilin-type N-terminal cleavage/methylation domain-containing protein